MTILEYIDKLEKEKRLQYHAMQEQRRARLIRPEKEARHDPTTEEMNQRPQISIKRMPAGTATTLLTVMRTCAGLSLTEKIVDVKGVNANVSTSELNEDEIKMIAQSMTEQASVESETNPICGVPTEQDGKMRNGEESSMDVRVQHDETQQDDIVSRQDTPSINKEAKANVVRSNPTRILRQRRKTEAVFLKAGTGVTLANSRTTKKRLLECRLQHRTRRTHVLIAGKSLYQKGMDVEIKNYTAVSGAEINMCACIQTQMMCHFRHAHSVGKNSKPIVEAVRSMHIAV